MTYQGQGSRTANRILTTLVVITIAVVALWATSGGFADIHVTEIESVTVSE